MLHLQDSLRRTLENRRSTKCEARQTLNVIEGIGSSNGVNYAYTLNSSPWHASYEWRVHRSVLDRSCKIHTNRFSVGGVLWRVYLTHHDNGQVVARLKSWNWGRMNAHYAFTLVNHTNCGLGDFLLTSCKEVSPIMTASEIRDPHSGYLKDEWLTLRMDLRIRRRVNEHCSMSITERALKCEWSLKYAWEMCPSTIRTDIFKVGDREMQLEFREEKSFGMKKGVSVLLRNLSHLPIYVRGELHIRNRRDSEFVARIDAGNAKGWIQILKEQDFIDGCSVKDGWVTLATNIALLTPKDFENATVPIPKHLSSDTISQIDVQRSRLTLEKGDAVTDGIKHAHMITRDEWCASYKWFVHRSLLEMTNKVIFTNPFGVEETQWYVEMEHAKDGNLKCCLCSKNETPVVVQFEFTLVNFADADKSISRGSCHTFLFADDRLGFSFLPRVEIESFDSGYVQNDYLLTRLDLRLKKEDNESCQIAVDGASATCEWKLRSIRDRHPLYLRTETVTLGNTQMQLCLRPKNADGSGPFEIFVSNLHCEIIRMKGTVRVICHSGSTEDDRVKDFHCIVSPKSCHGSGIILEQDVLDDELGGFVRDGWIFLKIQITQLTVQEFEDVASAALPLPNKTLSSTQSPVLDDLMHVEEGNGVSDGSAYTYVLNKYKYYATYECCVDRSLLDKKNSQIVTETFGLSNGKWKIALVYKDSGQLEALLCYEGEERAAAHFSFVVLNCNDSKKDLVLGDFRTFSSEVLQNKWGFDLCPITTINDPSLGFLRDDRFMVRLELRLKLPENETWGTSIDRKTARCTWMLKDLKDLSPLLLKSEIFMIDGSKWRLRLCPNGETSDSNGLEMYLINKQSYPIRARIGFCAVNHKSSAASEDRIRGFTKVIDAHSGWGIGKFLDSEELVNESLGFVDNGWIAIAAKITVLDDDEIPPRVLCNSAPMCSVLYGTKEHLCGYNSSAKLLQESLDVDPAMKGPECQETVDGIAVRSTSVEKEEVELWRCQSTMAPILVDDGPN